MSRAVASPPKIQLQSRRLLVRLRVLGDAAVASADENVPLGGEFVPLTVRLSAYVIQGMNEHAIYDAVGHKKQR